MPSAKDIANARAKAILDSEREGGTSPAETGIPISPAEGADKGSTESGELGEPETVAGSENTPGEWREKLKNLIAGAKEQLIGGESREQPRAERLRAHLNERSQNLQERAKGLGPKAVETVGSVIERYNKLNWKTKLAVTGTLMLGVSSTAVAIPLVSGALTVALYGQRLVGAVGLGMNKRKKLDAKIAANPEHWMAGKSELAKNTYAGALAAVYMAGTAFAVYEGVELLRSLGISDWFSGSPDAPDTEPPHTEAPAETTIPSTDTSVPHTETATEAPTNTADAPVPAESADADSSDTASATSEEAPTDSDVKPVETKPDGNLAAKEFGTEYAAPETVPEDLSAQEWRAEYAEPVNHAGAPEWRAEHVEAEVTPETPAEAPAPADAVPQAQVAEEAVAPQNAVPADAPEAGVASAPHAEHLVVNAHGLSIDANHAGTYMDTQGNHIVYGGTLDDRAELAKQWVVKDHSAVVFFESTRDEKFLGLFSREVPHLSMAQWVDAGGESGVHIAEDTNDPSLVGIMLPTANDLAQAYKPAN